METRRLEYFVQIVESKSINKAAARIGIAQPALSQQLAILEGEFKTRLLLRTAKGVEVTPAGQVLYQQSLLLLRQLNHARLLVADQERSPSGAVSLGLPTTTANLLSMPIVRRARERFPNVLVQIKEGVNADLTKLVLQARLDMAVLFTVGPRAGLDVVPLWVEQLLLVAPPGASLPHRIDLQDAARLPLVMPAQGNGARDVLDAVLDKHGLAAHIVAEIDSTISLKRAVHDGIGHTFMPWGAVFEEVGRDELVVTAVNDSDMIRTVSLCYPADVARTRPMECLTSLMLEEVSALLNRKNIPGIWRPG